MDSVTQDNNRYFGEKSEFKNYTKRIIEEKIKFLKQSYWKSKTSTPESFSQLTDQS